MHYELSGPRSARVVVLVHGFSVPSFIWDPTYRFLVAAGLQVLRYDLFGRGYSDRPDTVYGMPLFVGQLQQLLDALALGRADLIALSMGGPIAAAFCVAFPERVDRLVLIGPSGAKPLSLGLSYRLAARPGISDALFGVAGNEYMLNTVVADFFDPAHIELFRERYRTQMAFRGFRRAILSTVRAKMLGSFESTYARLGQIGKRILIVWGEDDRTVPFDHNTALRRLLPGAEFMPVAHCGHIPHFERPDVINPRLFEFLS